MNRVRRTMGGLREALFEELDSLRANQISASRARASASLGNAIVQAVATELSATPNSGNTNELGHLKIGDALQK